MANQADARCSSSANASGTARAEGIKVVHICKEREAAGAARVIMVSGILPKMLQKEVRAGNEPEKSLSSHMLAWKFCEEWALSFHTSELPFRYLCA